MTSQIDRNRCNGHHQLTMVIFGNEKVLRCIYCTYEEPYEDEDEDERLN